MPCVDKDRNGRSSLIQTCGLVFVVVILVAVLGAIGIYIYMARLMSSAISTALSGTPPPRSTKPYKFGYSGVAAKCYLPLPEGWGSVTYQHGLGDGRGLLPVEGERAVTLTTRTGKSVDCPLGYFAPPKVRVGFYWYPEKHGSGPYLRLYDSCEESIVDVRRGVTQHLIRESGKAYSGDRIDYYESIISSSKPGSTIVDVKINGKPATDVTSIFGKNKGQYLGSVVRVGNKLIFTPASKGSGK